MDRSPRGTSKASHRLECHQQPMVIKVYPPECIQPQFPRQPLLRGRRRPQIIPPHHQVNPKMQVIDHRRQLICRISILLPHDEIRHLQPADPAQASRPHPPVAPLLIQRQPLFPASPRIHPIRTFPQYLRPAAITGKYLPLPSTAPAPPDTSPAMHLRPGPLIFFPFRGPSSQGILRKFKVSKISSTYSLLTRSLSRSSIRSRIDAPDRRASAAVNANDITFPKCNNPLGVGAILVLLNCCISNKAPAVAGALQISK